MMLVHKLRRGVATTEFAICLPLLTMLCVVAIDFGRYAHTCSAVTNAARNGCEYGASHQFTDHTKESWEDNLAITISDEMSEMANYDPDEFEFEVTTVDDGEISLLVTVSVSHPYHMMVTWPGFENPLMIQRTISMRQYR